MARFVVDHGEVRPAPDELVGDVITIGRDPSNNIVIDDPTVSAQHASLTRSPTGYRLIDLGSTNGTEYNGVRITDTELKDGDKIRFGSVAAVFQDTAAKFDQTEGLEASIEHNRRAPVINAFFPRTLTRKQYVVRWLVWLALLVVAVMLLFVGAPTGTLVKIGVTLVYIVVLLAFIYNIFGLSIPRLRNARMSLWTLLLLFIPAGALALFVVCAVAPTKSELVSESSTGKTQKSALGEPSILAPSRIPRKRLFATVGVLAIVAIFIIAWTAIVRQQNKRATGQSFDLVELARRTRDAVVLIEAFDSGRNEIATGSGFFVSGDGLLITNAHVIEGAASVAAKTESGLVLPVKGAVRVDLENDLAVLMVEAKNLPFLPLGQSGVLETGDHIAVIGSPLGLEGSLSEGIVSAKREEADRARKWLQITAPISPGSSGSPVLNASGKVIGVATMGLRGGQSLNFAVPAELVVAMLNLRDQKPSAPIPLQALARANALDNNTAELAVLQSAEFVQVETARLKATAAAQGNSIGRYKQTDWGNLLNATKALVAKYPDSSSAHEELGLVYEDMGFSEEAIEAYQSAVKLDADSPEAWKSLASIYKEKGKITQADFAFSQAIALEQKRVESQPPGFGKSFSLAELGRAYQSAGNNEAAK
jgi:S1-C subfamily serine protease